MATEVHSIPALSKLLGRRSGSRLQLLSEHATPPPADAHTQNKDGATRASRGSLTSPFTFTPLTPILASPVLTPAVTTVGPSNSANPIIFPSNSIYDPGEGVKHQRSRSTLSRLHVTLPDGGFDTQRHVRSATLPAFPGPYLSPGHTSGTPPSPCFLKDIILVDGIPIAKTPSPAEETPLPMVDFPTVSPRVSSAQNLSRSRGKSARKSFMLGSDDEDDDPEQQKREAAAKAKKLEKYDHLRRYNALMELLKTEAKYLQDLRILVNVCGFLVSFVTVLMSLCRCIYSSCNMQLPHVLFPPTLEVLCHIPNKLLLLLLPSVQLKHQGNSRILLPPLPSRLLPSARVLEQATASRPKKTCSLPVPSLRRTTYNFSVGIPTKSSLSTRASLTT